MASRIKYSERFGKLIFSSYICIVNLKQIEENMNNDSSSYIRLYEVVGMYPKSERIVIETKYDNVEDVRKWFLKQKGYPKDRTYVAYMIREGMPETRIGYLLENTLYRIDTNGKVDEIKINRIAPKKTVNVYGDLAWGYTHDTYRKATTWYKKQKKLENSSRRIARRLFKEYLKKYEKLPFRITADVSCDDDSGLQVNMCMELEVNGFKFSFGMDD